MFSEYNALKIEVNNKYKWRNNSRFCKVNSSLLINKWIVEKIKEKIKRNLETIQNKNTR